MRRVVLTALMLPLFVLGVGLMAAAEQDKDKPKPGKKSPIEGTWSTTKGDAKVSLTFTGNKFALRKSNGDKSEEVNGTFKLDTKATPNAIDMTVTGGDSKETEKYKGKTSHGIVKVDGDKLEWCANEPGKEGRPKTFANKDGDMGFLYITFDREKK